MGIIDIARRDMQRFTSDKNGFGVEISFTAPTLETAVIVGLATKHHLAIDTDGTPINSKHASVSFAEKLLIDLNYPVRNLKGEVDLKNHRVSVKDSTGLTKNYIVKQWFPDEVLGLIPCILTDFK